MVHRWGGGSRYAWFFVVIVRIFTMTCYHKVHLFSLLLIIMIIIIIIIIIIVVVLLSQMPGVYGRVVFDSNRINTPTPTIFVQLQPGHGVLPSIVGPSSQAEVGSPTTIHIHNTQSKNLR